MVCFRIVGHYMAFDINNKLLFKTYRENCSFLYVQSYAKNHYIGGE